MERLRTVLCVIGCVAIAIFVFARAFGIEEWRWAFFAVGTLCAIVAMFADYKERKGIFAEGNSKTVTVIYTASMLLVLTACVIHFATGGEAEDLLLLALLVCLGTFGWLRLRRKSDE